MTNISSTNVSTRTCSMASPPASSREHTFLSQFVMIMAIFILLIGFCPYVSSSPTPSSNIPNNKINYESNGFALDPTDYQATGDSSLLSSPVQDSLSGSSPIWYVQPRTHANQFLMSYANDHEVIVPKWFTRFHSDDQINDDDLTNYVSPRLFSNKRSSSNNNGGYFSINQRKQLAKPPMEVMNEIVNSIYLKR